MGLCRIPSGKGAATSPDGGARRRFQERLRRLVDAADCRGASALGAEVRAVAGRLKQA